MKIRRVSLTLSLRMRFTLMAAVFAVAAVGAATWLSMRNARAQFGGIAMGVNAFTISQEDLSRFAGTLTYTHGGILDVDAFAPDSAMPNAYIELIQTPVTQAVTRANNQFDLYSYLMLGGLCLACTVFAYFIAGRALRPLRALENRLESLRAENAELLPERTRARRDEIGRLEGAFYDMARRVHQAFARQKRFSASAAHELKTPLATVKTALQVLEMDGAPDADAYRETLEFVGQSVDRLSTVVDDLLLLAGGESPGRDSVDFDEALRGVVAELLPLIEARRACVQTPMAGLSVRANRALLHRAIANLLENAVKYGGEDVCVLVCAQNTPCGVRIFVENNGPPIPAHAQANVFEPFFRVDASRSRKTAGSGLGLALVREIACRHGGDACLECSVPGATRFAIVLPGE